MPEPAWRAPRRAPGSPPELSLRRFLSFTGRALLLRCPSCGRGGILRDWFHLRPACTGCALRTDRGEADAWVGGWMINFIVAELTAALLILLGVMLTWPDVPWRVIQYGGVALMLATPLLFFPFSRTLWLAVHLAFHPPTETDFCEDLEAHA